MISQIGIGYLADRFNVLIIMFLFAFFSALAFPLCLGLQQKLHHLALLRYFLRTLRCGFSVLYCQFATALSDHQPTQT
jgi:MFS family permease